MVEKTNHGGNNTYRYGFNGQEHEDEIDCGGGDYDFGARIYDPRTGRFLSLDPQSRNYPSISPYCFAGNTPIAAIDEEGKGPILAIIGAFVGGGTEIVGQLLGALYTRATLHDALKSIDWHDVLTATLAGSLDGMLPGLSKLSTVLIHTANVLLNAEFDYDHSLGKGNRFTYGFGNIHHHKDSHIVLIDVMKGMVGVLIDAKIDLGKKVSNLLDNLGLKDVITEGIDELPVSDVAANVLLTPANAGIDLAQDKAIERAQPSHTRNVDRKLHHRTRDANKKINLRHPRSSSKKSPYKNIQYTTPLPRSRR